MRPAIDFFFDFSSPYSYIASEWVDAVAARHGRVVHWHAILLGATFQAAELTAPVAHPLKREYSLRDFARSARFAGVPFELPEKFPIPTQHAARVFWWLHDSTTPEQAVAWAHAGMRAYFTRDVDLSDVSQLGATTNRLIATYGLPVPEVYPPGNGPLPTPLPFATSSPVPSSSPSASPAGSPVVAP